MSESGFMMIYKIKLERTIRELKLELEDVNNKVDTKTKTPYELYIKKLELNGLLKLLKPKGLKAKGILIEI